MKRVFVSLAFDQPTCRDFRFLQEAARLGEVQARLWSDAGCRAATGHDPKYPEAERRYLLEAVRYVSAVQSGDPETLPPDADPANDLWVAAPSARLPDLRSPGADRGLTVRVITDGDAAGVPRPPPPLPSQRPKVVVTGCYDFFHSGHVRFFEEAAELGDVYAIVGNDENIRRLKGDGHPLFTADERRYVVGSIRQVHHALIATGMGWLDAEPEMQHIRPDFYVVNEDGDRPEKRAYCEQHGIRYVVRQRVPRPGLPRRTSTDLRGF